MAQKREPEAGSPLNRLRALLPYLFLLLLVATLFLVRGPRGIEISYSEFKERVAREQVAEVVFRDG